MTRRDGMRQLADALGLKPPVFLIGTALIVARAAPADITFRFAFPGKVKIRTPTPIGVREGQAGVVRHSVDATLHGQGDQGNRSFHA